MAKKQEKVEVSLEELEQMTKEFMLNQKTLRDLKGITDEELEATYAAAFNFYNYGKFDRASSLFEVLCQLDQYTPKYWMGLGASRQMLKNFKGATEAYSMAAIFDPTNPKPAMYATDCFIAMNDYSSAEKALIAVIALCEEEKQHKELLDKAREMMATVRKKLSNKKGEE